jgi:hypothetical protein
MYGKHWIAIASIMLVICTAGSAVDLVPLDKLPRFVGRKVRWSLCFWLVAADSCSAASGVHAIVPLDKLPRFVGRCHKKVRALGTSTNSSA